MKRIILLFSCLLLIFSFSGCVGNKTSGLQRSKYYQDDLKNINVNLSVKLYDGDILKLTFKNKTDNQYTYGYETTLEMFIDNKWMVIPSKDGYAVQEIAVVLEPYGENKEDFNLSDAYGKLKEGRYRILRHMYSKGFTNIATCEFNI